MLEYFSHGSLFSRVWHFDCKTQSTTCKCLEPTNQKSRPSALGLPRLACFARFLALFISTCRTAERNGKRGSFPKKQRSRELQHGDPKRRKWKSLVAAWQRIYQLQHCTMLSMILLSNQSNLRVPRFPRIPPMLKKTIFIPLSGRPPLQVMDRLMMQYFTMNS